MTTRKRRILIVASYIKIGEWCHKINELVYDAECFCPVIRVTKGWIGRPLLPVGSRFIPLLQVFEVNSGNLDLISIK